MSRYHVRARRIVHVCLWSALLAVAAPSVKADVMTGFAPVDRGQLYYEDTGGAGSPVIMIHAGFLDHRMWDEQVPALAPGHRVIRYDVRYHGQSPSDPVPFSDVEDLADLMDALNVPKATLVGLSMGGQIALDFALAHPDRTTSLVLAGPGLSGFGLNAPEMKVYIEDLMEAAQRDDFDGMLEVFTRYWCDGPHRAPDQVDPAVRAKVLAMLAGSGARWNHYKLQVQPDPPAADRVSSIAVPTLLVLGLADMQNIHRVVDYLAKNIPGAERVDVPDVAHMVNMEAPARFNELLAAFLDRLQGQVDAAHAKPAQ